MRRRPEVLIADDSPLVCWAVRRALHAAGYDVVEAHTRNQVLHSLVAHAFRLVILSPTIATETLEDVAATIAGSIEGVALIVLTEDGVLPNAVRGSPSVRSMDRPFSILSLVAAARDLVPTPGQSPTDVTS